MLSRRCQQRLQRRTHGPPNPTCPVHRHPPASALRAGMLGGGRQRPCGDILAGRLELAMRRPCRRCLQLAPCTRDACWCPARCDAQAANTQHVTAQAERGTRMPADPRAPCLGQTGQRGSGVPALRYHTTCLLGATVVVRRAAGRALPRRRCEHPHAGMQAAARPFQGSLPRFEL